MIWQIMQIEEGVDKVEGTLWNLHNSSYHTKAVSINCPVIHDCFSAVLV